MADQPRQSSARLGRYELVEALGAGGMGQVYRARAYAAAGVTKDVCVKRIRSGRLDQPAAIRRFIAEARLSMSLSHANIVPVFDFGRADDGYFLAMEWVDGADLRSVLKHGSLSAIVAAYIGGGIARALAHAHDEHGASTVHRDVKPANVLLARSGDVKLADFGVAAVVGSARGVAGTLAYMAPEQRTGALPTPAADLFSLGKVLEEMIADTEAPVLSAIIASLLDPDPTKRPANADDVAESLEAYIATEQVGGAPSPRATLRERVRSAGRERTPVEDLLGAELSFVRDGHDATFSTRMGASGSKTPAVRTSRGAWLALGVVLTLGTVALAGRNQTAEDPDSRADSRETLSVEPVIESPIESPVIESPEPDPVSAEMRSTSEMRSTEAMSDAMSEAMSEATTSEMRPMSARAFGTLNVNAIPWANVFLDGRAIGETPLLNVRVEVGEHEVRLVNEPMGVSRESRVVIEEGQAQRLVVRLD